MHILLCENIEIFVTRFILFFRQFLITTSPSMEHRGTTPSMTLRLTRTHLSPLTPLQSLSLALSSPHLREGSRASLQVERRADHLLQRERESMGQATFTVVRRTMQSSVFTMMGMLTGALRGSSSRVKPAASKLTIVLRTKLVFIE